MAWESRGNREYYYEKEWIDGKCVSKYIGTGARASFITHCEKVRRIEKQQERANKNRKCTAELVIDEAIDTLSELNKSLVDALFLVNGYHQHKREWRKKR